MNPPNVSIIILNWNGWSDTIECLESLYRITYPSYNVIVVDNNSSDESIEKIKEYCNGKLKLISKFFEYSQNNKPIEFFEYTQSDALKDTKLEDAKFVNLPSNRKVILIKNDLNYGFAEGNNIAIRYALKCLNSNYFLLLNNDTVVDNKFLDELVTVAQSDESIGIVGPKVYYYDYNGKNNVIWSAGGNLCWWHELVYSHIGFNKIDNGDYDLIKSVDWISGAALMVKASILNESSLLNSKYFFGSEDVELCIKVKRKGLRIIYVPKSKVWHKVGISRSKIGFRIRNFGDYFFFIKQNFSSFIYIYHVILFLIIILPKSAILYILKYRDKESFFNFLSNIRGIFINKR